MSPGPDLPGKGKKNARKVPQPAAVPDRRSPDRPPLERGVCNIFVPPYGFGRAYVKKIKRPFRS